MLGKTREAVFVGSVVVPQVDKLLRRESLPAEGTLRLLGRGCVSRGTCQAQPWPQASPHWHLQQYTGGAQN